VVLEAGDNHFPGLDRSGLIPWPLYSNDEIKMSVRRFDYQDPLPARAPPPVISAGT